MAYVSLLWSLSSTQKHERTERAQQTLDKAPQPDNAADIYVKAQRKLLRASNMATDITKEYYIMYMYNTSSGLGQTQQTLDKASGLELSTILNKSTFLFTSAIPTL